jgi:hypothetical protein
LINAPISGLNSIELRQFDRNNFILLKVQEFTQTFRNEANKLLSGILEVDDKKRFSDLEQEISDEVKKEVNRQHAERCILVIIPEELEKLKKAAYSDIKQEFENISIDDGYNYSFSKFITKIQQKFGSIIIKKLKDLNPKIVLSPSFEDATTNLENYILKKVNSKEKSIKKR